MFVGVPVALIAIIVAYLWQDIGYNLVIFIAALQWIPDSLNEASMLDGANAWQTFRYVTLPLLKPTILLAAILTMISSFQVFDLFQVMTNGGPDNQTRVLSLDIYQSAFSFQRWAGPLQSLSCCSLHGAHDHADAVAVPRRRSGRTDGRRRPNDRRQASGGCRDAQPRCRGSDATPSAASLLYALLSIFGVIAACRSSG